MMETLTSPPGASADPATVATGGHDGFSALLRTAHRYLYGGDAEQEARVDDDYVLSMLSEATHHKLVPLVASLYRLDSRLSRSVRLHLRDLHGMAAHRLRVYAREALRAQELLAKEGIPVLYRKGMVLSQWIFRSPADRYCSDIDVYCNAPHGSAAIRALCEAGWRVGEQDGDRKYRELTRTETVFTALFPDHLPRLVLETDDLLEPCISLDISVDLGWTGAPMATDRAEFLSAQLREAAPVSNSLCSAASLAFHFLDVTFHLYRDAFFAMTIDARKDVHLSKFLDLAIIWSRVGDEVHRLRVWTAALGAGDIVGWVTHHVDAIFGCEITKALGLEASVSDGSIRPYTWQAADGTVHAWEGTMVDRLRAKSRPGSNFRGAAAVP